MKDNILKYIMIILPAAVIIVMAAHIYEQKNIIEQLTVDLSDTQEQLLISNDQLKQIAARNEAIKYMEGIDE